MTAAESVRTFVLTLSPVTALVSGRVFSPYLPQDMTASSFPALLIQQISDVQEPHLRGTSALRRCRIQVDAYAKTIAAARALDQAVMGTYTAGSATGLRGTTATIGAAQIVACQSSRYSEAYEAEELGQRRVSRDYDVFITGLD